jgi:hypothetical protein
MIFGNKTEVYRTSPVQAGLVWSEMHGTCPVLDSFEAKIHDLVKIKGTKVRQCIRRIRHIL